MTKGALKTTSTSNLSSLGMRMNGDHSSSYLSFVKYGEGSGFGTFAYGPGNNGHYGYASTNNSQFNVYSYSFHESVVYGYSASIPKNYIVDSHVQADNPATAITYQSTVQGIVSGGWNSNDPVTSIDFVDFGSLPFVEGTTITLYGIV
jgi:hypothetical protein